MFEKLKLIYGKNCTKCYYYTITEDITCKKNAHEFKELVESVTTNEVCDKYKRVLTDHNICKHFSYSYSGCY